jgi:hypothetical protein
MVGWSHIIRILWLSRRPRVEEIDTEETDDPFVYRISENFSPGCVVDHVDYQTNTIYFRNASPQQEPSYVFSPKDLRCMTLCVTYYLNNVPVSGVVASDFSDLIKKLTDRADYLEQWNTFEKPKVRRIRA